MKNPLAQALGKLKKGVIERKSLKKSLTSKENGKKHVKKSSTFPHACLSIIWAWLMGYTIHLLMN